jgi:hypothetical protein
VVDIGSIAPDGNLAHSGNSTQTGPLDIFMSFTLLGALTQNVEVTYSHNKAFTANFQLYSGGSCGASTCTGGSPVAGGSQSISAPNKLVDIPDLILTPGFYYFETLTGPNPGPPTYNFTGSVFTQAITDSGGGVPEPAAWITLLAGFFGVGSAVRGGRRKRAERLAAA